MWPSQAAHQSSDRAPWSADLPFPRPRRTTSTSRQSTSKPLKPFTTFSGLLLPTHLLAPQATPRVSSGLASPKIGSTFIDSPCCSPNPRCRLSKQHLISEEIVNCLSIRRQAFEQAPLKQINNSMLRRALDCATASSEPFEIPLMISSAFERSEELSHASESTLVSREPLTDFS